MLKPVTRWETKIFLGVFLIGFVFAAFTQHAWEDFYIVLRQAQNLAAGHGLVYQVGERLHTFTSPLGVLLPAAITWVTRSNSHELVLWIFRMISLAALASGVVLLYQILRHFQRHAFATVITLLLIALDAKTIDFSINGMETGLLLFFLALALHGLLLSGPRQLWRIGLGFAGLMWCRPDSCIYIAALGFGALVFLPDTSAGESRGHWWKRLLLAGVICTGLYLPWFLWAWSYYGSPVPQPILAKSLNATGFSAWEMVQQVLFFPLRQFTPQFATVWKTYMPAYGEHSWPAAVIGTSQIIAWATSIAWACPLIRPPARVLSFATFVGQIYLGTAMKMIYPWYLPIVAVLGYLTLGLSLDQLLAGARTLPKLNLAQGWFRHLSLAIRMASIVLVLGQLWIFVCSARQMQVLQHHIEDGVRHPLGAWLHDHARSPNDTVMLEPLGYVGYFSQLRMLDYLGLASQKMVATRQRLAAERARGTRPAPPIDSIVVLDPDWVAELKPDWIVVRPDELVGGYYLDMARMKESYDLAAVFDQSDQLAAISWLPGRGVISFYQTYLVFHRKDAPHQSAAP